MIGSCASQAVPEQGDLFEGRGTRCGTDAPQKDMGDKNLEGLSDKDLVGKIAKATLSNVDLLCAQIMERGLGDMAVPSLVALWNRFKGFGIKSPQDAAAIGAVADGVVVGSALVGAIAASLDGDGKATDMTLKSVADLTASLAQGVRGARLTG